MSDRFSMASAVCKWCFSVFYSIFVLRMCLIASLLLWILCRMPSFFLSSNGHTSISHPTITKFREWHDRILYFRLPVTLTDICMLLKRRIHFLLLVRALRNSTVVYVSYGKNVAIGEVTVFCEFLWRFCVFSWRTALNDGICRIIFCLTKNIFNFWSTWSRCQDPKVPWLIMKQRLWKPRAFVII